MFQHLYIIEWTHRHTHIHSFNYSRLSRTKTGFKLNFNTSETDSYVSTAEKPLILWVQSFEVASVYVLTLF